MARRKNNSEKKKTSSALAEKDNALKKQKTFSSDSLNNITGIEDRSELAKKLNIDLVRPSQQNRILALKQMYEQNLIKSKLSSFLYSSIIENCNKLIEIYKKQRSEIQKLDLVSEDVEFIKRRLAFVINRYRSQIDTAYANINKNKILLADYTKQKNNPAELIPDSKEELARLRNIAWSHHLKTVEINREYCNNIIGYKNRMCLYQVGNLYLDYQLYVKQELNNYREQLKQLNIDNEYQFNEILRHFDLPPTELTKFQDFLKAKLESRLINAQSLKVPFGKFYDFDVQQIDRMVREIREQQDKDFQQIVQVINHYKRMLLKKQTKANQYLNELISYAKKRYDEKIKELEKNLKLQESIYSNDKAYLSQDEIDLLLNLNRQELKIRIEQLKHKYSNKIKPLIDDFQNMEMLIERDYVFDRRKLHEQLSQLKFLENENVGKFTKEFEASKAKLVELFDNKYNFIKSDIGYIQTDFQKTIEKLRLDVENITTNILDQHQQYWTNVNLEFNSEARKFLAKFHYENAPWTHLWKGTNDKRGWMHDYLLINLSAEYLNHVGESLRGFSPEYQLYINIAKALVQYNEKTRQLYKERDEAEFEQLINLNTIPDVDVSSLKQTFNQCLVNLKNEELNYQKTLKNFLDNLNQWQ
ncbi:hypothetical protein MCAV_01770 [[Mycoplasma] cavipharyngis]|uniref:hypothetical protein n=1 Tax=[Mycoplasma] cavipharyngis TaxID=92757 RepID=UPI003704BB97